VVIEAPEALPGYLMPPPETTRWSRLDLRPAGEPAGEAPPVPVARPSLWRNRNFLLLWGGQATSNLGTSITELALPLLVLALTDSPAQAGFVTAVGMVPNLFLSLIAGAVVDRWNRKLVMILCDVTRFLAFGSIPLSYALGYLSLEQLYVVAAVQGVAFVFFGLAEFSSLPNVVTPEQIPRATSLNEAAEASAQALGPGLAGAIINLSRTTRTGAALAFLVDSLSYLVSAVTLLFIRIPFEAEREKEAQVPLLRQIAEGLRYLWSKSGLRVMLLATLGIVLFTGPLYLGVIMLATSMGADAFTVGLIFSLGSIGGITGALIAPWVQDRVGIGKVVVAAALVPALLLPVLAMAGSPWVLVLGWAIIDVTVPFFNIAQVSYRFSLVPDAVQGRVSSVFRMVGFGGIVLGTSLGGVLLDQLGPRTVFLMMAVGLALTAAMVCLTEIWDA
jgi:MFS family permease